MKKNIYTQLRDIENGMNDLLSAMSSLTHNKYTFNDNCEEKWTPNCDVYISANKLHIIVELAGIDKESMQIKLTDKELLLVGNRDFKLPSSDVCYYYMEIETGAFERVIRFPEVKVDIENVTTKLEKGMLKIVLNISEYQAGEIGIEEEE
jgi:HSP20 family protein